MQHYRQWAPEMFVTAEHMQYKIYRTSSNEADLFFMAFDKQDASAFLWPAKNNSKELFLIPAITHLLFEHYSEKKIK